MKIVKVVVVSKVKDFNHVSFYKVIDSLQKDGSISISFMLDTWFEGKLTDVSRINRKNWFKLARIINNYDILIYEPPTSIWENLFFLIFIRKKTIMIVHNVNRWLFPPAKFSLKNMSRYFFRRMIMQKVSALIVVDFTVKKYLENFLQLKKQTFFLPFSEIQRNVGYEKQDNGLISFTIPGIVENRRRDYYFIFQVFENIISKGYGVKLILLGRIDKNDDDLFDYIKSFIQKYPENIDTYDDYVDQDTFDQVLANSDYLIGNLRVTIEDDYTFERYGSTKASGILYLMINYRKITFIPKELLVPDEVEELTIKYSSKDDLENKIISVFDERPDMENFEDQIGQYKERIESEKEMLKEYIMELND